VGVINYKTTHINTCSTINVIKSNKDFIVDPMYFIQIIIELRDFIDFIFLFPLLQVIKGLLKFWPKTCSQKEV
jgi:hypothetical protein